MTPDELEAMALAMRNKQSIEEAIQAGRGDQPMICIQCGMYFGTIANPVMHYCVGRKYNEDDMTTSHPLSDPIYVKTDNTLPPIADRTREESNSIVFLKMLNRDLIEQLKEAKERIAEIDDSEQFYIDCLNDANRDFAELQRENKSLVGTITFLHERDIELRQELLEAKNKLARFENPMFMVDKPTDPGWHAYWDHQAKAVKNMTGGTTHNPDIKYDVMNDPHIANLAQSHGDYGIAQERFDMLNDQGGFSCEGNV